MAAVTLTVRPFMDQPPVKVEVPSTEEMFAKLAVRLSPELAPALYDDSYYPAYAAVAAWKRPRRVLEIGVRLGYSLIAMASGHRPSEVAGIDSEADPASNLGHARQNLAACGFVDMPTVFIRDRSSDVSIKDLGGPFDLVHVDGGHDESTCLHDIEMAFQVLASGGVVIVDDLSTFSVLAAFEATARVPGRAAGYVMHKHGMGVLR